MSGTGNVGGSGGVDPSKKTSFKQAQKQAEKIANASPSISGREKAQRENQAAYTRQAESAKLQSSQPQSVESQQASTGPQSEPSKLIANRQGSQVTAKSDTERTRQEIKAGQDANLAETKSGLKPEEVVSAKNPILGAELEKRTRKQDKVPVKEKQLKSPPHMSLKVKLKPKIAINPRRTQPWIPNRLQSFLDDGVSNLEKLRKILQSLPSYQDKNLTTIYAKKLLNKNQHEAFVNAKSLAELLGLDESIINYDRNSLANFLSKQMGQIDFDQETRQLFSEIFSQLNNPDINLLKPLVLLFMPFPFPYVIMNVDDEFFEDELELSRDDFEDDEDDEESSQDEDLEDSDEGTDRVRASISLKTLNYGKLHLYLKYNTKKNKMHLSIKGDSCAEDMTVAIEANLETALQDVNLMQNELKLWHDNVLRITELRTLKINSEGSLNPTVLRACNSILETVYKNDLEDLSGKLDGEYKVL